MPVKSTQTHYGRVAASIHWISALAVIFMLASGQAMDWAPRGQGRAILPFHVGLGALLALLTLARIVWWSAFDRHPHAPIGMSNAQKFAAKAVHILLYVSLVIMLGSGIAMIVLSGSAQAVFFGGALPRFSALPPFGAHTIISKVLLVLVIGHIVAALWHQLVLKDNVLARMRPH